MWKKMRCVTVGSYFLPAVPLRRRECAHGDKSTEIGDGLEQKGTRKGSAPFFAPTGAEQRTTQTNKEEEVTPYMFKMLNPRRFYHAVGRKKFLEFLLLAAFILFFYGPMLNMLMLAFANEYTAPAVLPQQWGFKWWSYVFSQNSLVSSIVQSFIVAIVTTAVPMVLCIPAAYSIARFKYRGRKIFMLSFLLTNAFPKLGIYTSIAVLFYRYGLMGTYAGVVIIHMINSMMFMVWLPASAFRSVHRQQEEAARDVGAGPVRTFFKITLPMAMPGIAVATLYTFLGSMEEAQGTLLVGMAKVQTMPVAMYGIVLDSSAVQIGAVFAILLIIPSALMIFLMRKYIGPEAISGGFKMK